MDLVEIVRIDVTPVDEGVMLVGENVKVPQGLIP
jgi:hypothetical protein